MNGVQHWEAAWRVHDVAAGAVARADGKAAFAASLETAVAAAAATMALSARQRPVLGSVLLLVGGVALTVAIVAAPGVVSPVLNRTARDQFLYFGALRACPVDELLGWLGDDELIEKVCWQSVTRLAWRKHRLLRVSLLAATVGVVCVAASVLVAGGAA